jgi:hypothetical protein
MANSTKNNTRALGQMMMMIMMMMMMMMHTWDLEDKQFLVVYTYVL